MVLILAIAPVLPIILLMCLRQWHYSQSLFLNHLNNFHFSYMYSARIEGIDTN